MVKKKIYKATKGALFGQEEAQTIGEHLEKLMNKKNGELTTEDVLIDARRIKSPLNKYFDWNDTTAAIKYRMYIARLILNHIAEVTVIEGVQTEHKSFFNVKNEVDERVYVTFKTIKKNKSYKQQLLEEAENYISYLLRTIKLLKKNI